MMQVYQNENSSMLISEIVSNSVPWTARITITEEIETMTCRNGASLKRYVFTDCQGNQVIACIFGTPAHIRKLSSLLQLFKVYDISNAFVGEVDPPFQIMGKFLWYLQKETKIFKIPEVTPTLKYLPTNITPLGNVIDERENSNKIVGMSHDDVMGVLIKADEKESRNTERGVFVLRKFTIVDGQGRPAKFTLIEHLVERTGYPLMAATRKNSVVMAKRLAVNRNYGGLLSSVNFSSFIIDPPVEEASRLKFWFQNLTVGKLSEWLKTDVAETSTEQTEEKQLSLSR